MAGAYEQARQASDRARETVGIAIGHLQLLDYNHYRGLALAACYAELRPRSRLSCWRRWPTTSAH